MLTESYSFVRAQTSHKGEAATWSAYSWIRAWFVASRLLHGAVLWRVAFLRCSHYARTLLQSIQYALSWHPLWQVLDDSCFTIASNWIATSHIHDDSSAWLIVPKWLNERCVSLTTKFDTILWRNSPKFWCYCMRSNLMSVKRALVLRAYYRMCLICCYCYCFSELATPTADSPKQLYRHIACCSSAPLIAVITEYNEGWI